MSLELLSRLSNEVGPSGFEDRVVKTVLNEVRDYADEVRIDNMNNLIVRVGNGPYRVLVSAHIDEVGVMISHIDSRGFIKVIPIGGLDVWTLLNKELVFMGKNGDVVGTVGVDPPHLRREKPPSSFDEIYVDAGFTSADEAYRSGLAPGVPGTFNSLFRHRGSVIMGKALDDRVGCYVLIQVLRDVRNKVGGDYSVYFAWNTQEELGLRGINAVVNYVNPNLAFVVETTVAADVPNNPEHQWITRVGGGVAIRAADRSMITNPRLLSKALELASSRGVKYQVQVNPYGGTDAGVIHVHGTGVPTLVLSTPARYIHEPTSVASLDDVEQVRRLLLELLLNLDYLRQGITLSV
ncbi:M42 family metallopeptidase [Vulcanisaeta thermophila]|uniref:M42 family metallopeptidase n=1 Tax=Vulcanisaeta thermophila TaxID=867917 RepID=UPI000852FE2A|nr:M20/M25/M40 family metallo-hydrolase [Vulcanisaeta thermophila]